VTPDKYFSPSVNDLNSACKNDYIDHKLQKLGPFWTF